MLRTALLGLTLALLPATRAVAGGLTHTIIGVSADSITIGKHRQETFKITPETVVFIRGKKATAQELMAGMHATFIATEGRLMRIDIFPAGPAAK